MGRFWSEHCERSPTCERSQFALPRERARDFRSAFIEAVESFRGDCNTAARTLAQIPIARERSLEADANDENQAPKSGGISAGNMCPP